VLPRQRVRTRNALATIGVTHHSVCYQPMVATMRRTWLAVLLLALGIAGCATVQPAPITGEGQPTPSPPASLLPTAVGASVPLAPPLPTLEPIETEAAAARLQAELLQQVHDLVRQSPASVQRWITLARAMLAAHGTPIDRAQVLVVVDRNPLVQQLVLIVAQPDAAWVVLGGTHVSTGQPNRHGYYITPTGVFLHDGSILDYRAQGTFNENHIRGLGVKGMRIWDFGWQWADKGWLHTGERGQIRLLMHATDPAYLARRIGRPASEGCVRVPADMNRFMDHHGVLDTDYQQVAPYVAAYRAILPDNADPTPLAGDTLVVIDSSE
jgi:hypothetical protein